MGVLGVARGRMATWWAEQYRMARRHFTWWWAEVAWRDHRPEKKRWWTSTTSLVVLWAAIFIVVLGLVWGLVKAVANAQAGWAQNIAAFEFVFLPVWVAAVGYLGYLPWRWWRVTKWYRKRCKEDPAGRVPTAGSMIQQVIGRDDLCRVLMQNARHSATPNLVVGGVGAGKTAALVQLVRRLAQRGAVPVAVYLREAQGDTLDFHKLGYEAFERELSSRAVASGDIERSWQQLRRDNRIVVLADGLEEALIDDTKVDNRTNKIQRAIHDAIEARLPLIITSRQHGTLRALDASITTLEPIGEGAALDYLNQDDPYRQRRHLANLVQAADVADSPLYLRIIHDLVSSENRSWEVAPEHQLIRQLTTDFESELRQGQQVDRAGIRLRLLENWRHLLVDGHLESGYALRPERRRRTLLVLAALACVGLRDDRSEVPFVNLIGSDPAGQPEEKQPPSPIALHLYDELFVDRGRHDHRSEDVDRPDKKSLAEAVNRHVPLPECGDRDADEGGKLYRRLGDELELAAEYGSHLGIVEYKGRSVRFHHSIIFAYLGTDYLGEALARSTLLDAVLPNTFLDVASRNCGREFLLAIVLHSRARRQPGSRDEAVVQGREGSVGDTRSSIASGVIRRRWSVSHRDPVVGDTVTVTVQESLPAAISLTTAADHPLRWLPALVRQAHRLDRVDRLRLYTAVAEIEATENPVITGGRHWFSALADAWGKDVYEQPDIQDRTLLEAKANLLHRFGATVRLRAAHGKGADPDDGVYSYHDLFRIAVAENDTAIQLLATIEIAHGRDIAFRQLQQELGRWWGDWSRQWQRWRLFFQGVRTETVRADGDVAAMMDNLWKRGRVCALLAPMIYYHGPQDPPHGPVPAPAAGVRSAPENALENLKWWITEFLEKTDPRHPEKRPWISLEIALAQGFRHAANHRPLLTVDDAHRHATLIEQAEAALRHTRFWYAQLVLIQALTLLEMPEDPDEGIRDRGHSSDPERLVRYWMAIAGTGFAELEHRSGHVSHPFVREAAELCERALLTRRPDRYCWIDESRTVEKVGSHQEPGRLYEHQFWILPSTGWGALDKRAQRLLGDVMVMLNLSDRGRLPSEREERLSRADRSDLPPCVTRDPEALDVTRTIGSAKISDPGSNCHDGCLFRLCPYPPIGGPVFRDELPEGFCRQLRQARTTLRFEEGIPPRRRDHFWDQMAARARPGKQ
jgi:hypothetical protein